MKTLGYGMVMASALALGACGGGGGAGGSADTGGSTGTAGGPATLEGPITGFGSVYVNGTRVTLDRADIIVNGQRASETDLGVGMVVSVDVASRGDGQARGRRLFYDSDLEGPVSSVTPADNSLVVLGQRVRVTERTAFEDDDDRRGERFSGLADVRVGDFLEISGFMTGFGVVASRIEREDDDDDYELRGRVRDVDAAGQRFSINDLVVDWSRAALDDLAPADLRDGLLVVVEGRRLEGNVLFASEIEREDDPRRSRRGGDGRPERGDDDDDDREFELQGVVTAAPVGELIEINAREFILGSRVEFDGGSLSDLREGVLVAVEGRYRNDRLVIDEIEFERRPSIEFEGRVAAVAPTAGYFETQAGMTIHVNARTRYEDDDGDRYFNLARLRVGDRVEVKAYAQGTRLVAVQIEREGDDTECAVQGPVSNIRYPAFEIAGVTIQTDSRTEFDDFRDGSSFFEALSDGVIVEVEAEDGACQPGFILASEVEIDDYRDGYGRGLRGDDRPDESRRAEDDD